MSKLLIIAGNNSKNLRDFMIERGTFEVPFYYESLSKNINEIKNSIVKVDKMLYLFQPEIMSIRFDMGILQNLLTKSNFFEPGEITFMVNGNSEDNSKAIEYFQAVMDAVGYTNYRIKSSESTMTYANIYDQLLGVSQSVKFKNKRKNIYRVENSNESKQMYVPELTTDMIIEPFDYDSIINYSKAKENASRVESGLEHIDSMPPMKKFNRPSFGQININSILHSNKTVCISGLAKSGITTWTCALATSAFDLGKSVLILDYTNNQDILDMMILNRIKYKKFCMTDLVNKFDIPEDEIGICGIMNEKEDLVRFEFLQNFFSKVDTFDYVFVVTSIEHVEPIIDIIGDMLSKLFLCTTVFRHDILYLNKYISKIDDNVNLMVILNSVIKVLDDSTLLDDKECKELIERECKVVAPIEFKDLHLGSYLCIKLLEI